LSELEAILFREIETQYRVKATPSKIQEQLFPVTAQTILANLPERIRAAFIARAAEINYPVEAVVEMALAGYLDTPLPP
jgi:hypothetical protein